MSNSDFDAFVKRQQIEPDRNGTFNPQQRLAEWLNHLDALYEQIAEYLQTYTESGAAHIVHRDMSLNEEFLGAYRAREMILEIGRATVIFTPVGTMLIGTKGRVDVQGPVGTARLSLVNKQVKTARQLIQVKIRRAGDLPPAPVSSEAVKQIELVWKISTPPPEIRFIELTQDTFFETILAVANA